MAFPNVPNVPGVPALVRGPARIVENAALLVADVAGIFNLFAPRWGIYQDGVPVVTPDTVVAFDYRQNWTLADFPLEGGGFETYDKAASPFDARMRIATGGLAVTRQALLDQVAAIAGTTELYDAVTPEVTYRNVNVQRYDYRRTSGAVGLITIDLWLVEVRVATAPAFSSTKTPSGASPENGGTVQTSSFDESGFSGAGVT